MGTELTRPPRRITPEQFYTDYAPTTWSTAMAALGATGKWPAWRFELGFTVEGKGGGEFTLVFAAGELTGRVGPATSPLLHFTCELEGWQVATRHVLPQVLEYTEKHWERARRGVLGFLGGRAAALDVAVPRSHPGVVELRYTDDAGDTFPYVIAIAGGKGPQARLHATDVDLQAVLDAGSNVLALVRSRLRIDGDAGYIIKVLSTLLPAPR